MGCGKLTGGWVRVKEAAAVYTEERVQVSEGVQQHAKDKEKDKDA